MDPVWGAYASRVWRSASRRTRLSAARSSPTACRSRTRALTTESGICRKAAARNSCETMHTMKNLGMMVLAACVAGFSLSLQAQSTDQASEISETELSTGSSATDKEISESASGTEGTNASDSGTKPEPTATPMSPDKGRAGESSSSQKGSK
jgi:hypothetical protein